MKNKLRFILWLARRDRLLSNKLRFRRKIANSPDCVVCGADVEDSIHILRDCAIARHVWENVVPQSLVGRFFAAEIEEWVDLNLLAAKEMVFGCGTNWGSMFGATVWSIWRWRCGLVLQERFSVPSNPTRDVIRYAQLVQNILSPLSCNRINEEIIVKWSRPSPGWVKLNCDGASKGNPRSAGMGGVIRDSQGGWLVGFAGSLGWCSVTSAELHALRMGLKLAWDEGYQQICCEIDSQAVIALLKPGNVNAIFDGLVKDIRELLNLDWQVGLNHIYREGNGVADSLANLGCLIDNEVVIFRTRPKEADDAFAVDVGGRGSPRLITRLVSGLIAA